MDKISRRVLALYWFNVQYLMSNLCDNLTTGFQCFAFRIFSCIKALAISGASETRMSSQNWLIKILLLTVASSAVSACTSTGGSSVTDTLDVASNKPQKTEIIDPRAYCPKTVLRAGTETYRLFKKGVKKTDANALKSLRFQGTITEVVRECNYRGGILNIRVGLGGRVINGPTSETGTFLMPVRIAVTQGETVLYSQLHKVNGTIAPGKSNGFFRFVDGNINIPKPTAENIIIYAGYDEGPKG